MTLFQNRNVFCYLLLIVWCYFELAYPKNPLRPGCCYEMTVYLLFSGPIGMEIVLRCIMCTFDAVPDALCVSI